MSKWVGDWPLSRFDLAEVASDLVGSTWWRRAGKEPAGVDSLGLVRCISLARGCSKYLLKACVSFGSSFAVYFSCAFIFVA